MDARVGALLQQAKPRLQRDLIPVIAPHLANAGKPQRIALAMALMGVAIGVQKIDYHIKGAAQDVFGVNLQVF